MEQRISLVTLGVADVTRAREFYGALGWKEGEGSTDEVVFFQHGGIVFGVWDRDSLAEDSSVEDTGGWGGVTIAHNVRSVDEVNEVISDALDAGATLGREASETFWGGYSGVFIDPDGHPWEIGYNPFWTIDSDGNTKLGT